jgi:hypothetical protein
VGQTRKWLHDHVVRAGLPWSWGASDDERRAEYPSVALVPDPALRMIRAVDVAAPAAMTFRWICQLRLAPYSYDLIDNRGRRSPRLLTAGSDDLAVGTPFLLIFEIDGWTQGREITGVGREAPTRRFGPMACTYRVEQVGAHASRLVGRLDLTARGRALGVALAWGDLIMMRRQLRNLAALATRDHRSGCTTCVGE